MQVLSVLASSSAVASGYLVKHANSSHNADIFCSTPLAGLHDHFNQGRLSIKAFFQLIKGNLKAFKMKRLVGKKP